MATLSGKTHTPRQLAQMFRRAEAALFELILAEPSGCKESRLAMLEDSRDFIARCKARLRLTEAQG